MDSIGTPKCNAAVIEKLQKDVARLEAALEAYRWIPVGERLPKHRQMVHIIIRDPNPDRIDTATFYQGKIAKGVVGELISWEDQHANNKKPYGWASPPMYRFGQDVTHWQEIHLPGD